MSWDTTLSASCTLRAAGRLPLPAAAGNRIRPAPTTPTQHPYIQNMTTARTTGGTGAADETANATSEIGPRRGGGPGGAADEASACVEEGGGRPQGAAANARGSRRGPAEVPRVLGRGDEGAGSLGSAPFATDEDASANPGDGASAAEGGGSPQGAGARARGASCEDETANAIEKRRAEREGGLSNSVEVLGSSGESTRFSGNLAKVPRVLDEARTGAGGSAGGANASEIPAANVGEAEVARRSERKRTEDSVEASRAMTGEQVAPVVEKGSDGGGQPQDVRASAGDANVKDAKYKARATRRARRVSVNVDFDPGQESTAEGSIGGTLDASSNVLGYVDEVARIFDASSDDTKDAAKSAQVKDEFTSVLELCRMPKDPEHEEEASELPANLRNSSETSIRSEDLQNPVVIHGNNQAIPKSADDVFASNSSLGLEDLQRSTASLGQRSINSLVSDTSLGLDDLQRSPGSNYSKFVSDESLASSKEDDGDPRKKHHNSMSELSRRRHVSFDVDEEDRRHTALRARSAGLLLRNADDAPQVDLVPTRRRRSRSEYFPQRSGRLESRGAESRRRQAANRRMRTRVARQCNGRLAASNADSVRSRRLGLASSLIGPLSRRVTVEGPHLLRWNPRSRRWTENAAPPTVESLARRHGTEEGRAALRRSGDDVGIAAGDHGGIGGPNAPVNEMGRGRPHDISKGRKNSSGCPGFRLAPSEIENAVEEEQGPTANPGEGSKQEVLGTLASIVGWTPFGRYSRGESSSNIQMLENQFFIPPPEEGTTFLESLWYTWQGYGNDFVIWIYQASFFTVVSRLWSHMFHF